MDSYGILNKFMLICVDDMKAGDFPKGIERVPTLIVHGINKPLVANEAVEWFERNKQYFAQQNVEMQSKINLYNMAKSAAGNNAPKAFSNCEHRGVSDDFAYTDTDEAQQKEFCLYGNDGDIIITPPKDGTMNSSSQKKLLRDIEIIRKDQDAEHTKIMKQEQINKIISIERNQFMKKRMGI
jgi:hypothetical protein